MVPKRGVDLVLLGLWVDRPREGYRSEKGLSSCECSSRVECRERGRVRSMRREEGYNPVNLAETQESQPESLPFTTKQGKIATLGKYPGTVEAGIT